MKIQDMEKDKKVNDSILISGITSPSLSFSMSIYILLYYMKEKVCILSFYHIV